MKTLSILILMCTAVVANAQLVAYDDFSSGDESGGFGWATDWTEDDGTPTTMNFSAADPFSDGISAEYLSQGELIYYPKRALATPLQASTTPEVWAGVYLRPETLADSGWQFGIQIYKYYTTAPLTRGALCGLLLGDNNDYIRLANSYVTSPVGDGTSQFTLDQETMLVMRLYKNSPTDTLYNRADLYADLDGSDGRYNNEVVIATGLDLGTNSTEDISFIRINQSGYLVDFDYVAIGTTKESVINVMSPFIVIDESDDSTIVFETNATTDEFTMALTQDPCAVVEITVDPNASPNADDIQLAGAGGAGLPITLTFTRSNWDIPQTVTVQAEDDALPEGQETALLKFTGSSNHSDPNTPYNGLLGFLAVTVVDNDVAVVVVGVGDGVEVNEQGETSDSYTLVLGYPPTADVMITIGGSGDDSSDPNLPEPLTEVTVNGKARETLTFTSGNWGTAQTVTVQAVDDADVESDPHATTVAHRVFSDDLGYKGLAVDDVEVAIRENDCGSWGYGPMDFNQDCYVNLLDFAEFAAAWLDCTQPQAPGCVQP